MKKHGIELVCFDLNKTLLNETTWDDLNLALGLSREEDQRYIDEFAAGEITYREWTKILLDLYLQRGRADRQTILNSILRYTYRPGAKELVYYLKQQGYHLALISGSLDLLIDKIAQELEIKLAAANNTFVFNEQDQLIDIITLNEDDVAKVRHLQKFCDQLNITMGQVVCVGDGDNDIKLFEQTKHGITFTGSKIAGSAWRTVNQLSDIKNIL